MAGSVRISQTYRLIPVFLALWLWCVFVSAPAGTKSKSQESVSYSFNPNVYTLNPGQYRAFCL